MNYKQMNPGLSYTPNKVNYVKMPVADYLSEHKRLINLLVKVGKEGERQKKEINQFMMKKN